MNEDVYGESCVSCNVYTTYDNLYVVDVVPNEDGYLTKEILVCKWCKETEQ